MVCQLNYMKIQWHVFNHIIKDLCVYNEFSLILVKVSLCCKQNRINMSPIINNT